MYPQFTEQIQNYYEIEIKVSREEFNAIGIEPDSVILRAIAFQRPELIEPYVHLLDFEPCDEA
ncbi:MAG: DUF2555 domain-containing protein [Okeania sp. SIO2C9]|nr:DUF2555 domain-containing protein [Okeania sp. SIO2C9]